MPFLQMKDMGINPVNPNIFTSVDGYKKLIGTAFDCPSVPGPMYSNEVSVDNFYRYNYAINITPPLILSGSWADMYTRNFRNNEIPYPAEVALVGESNAGWVPTALRPYDSYFFRFYCWSGMAYYIEWLRHGTSCNWLFFDGHVEGIMEKHFWSKNFYFGHGGWMK
jgi:prepilin-type processing-associated H-X9-DG protein